MLACDRCGAIIPKPKTGIKIVTRTVEEYDGSVLNTNEIDGTITVNQVVALGIDIDKRFDLCGDCVRELKKWLKGGA